MEDNILVELTKEKNLIDSPDNPLRDYNYSYIKDLVLDKYGNKVSVPTIIARAKKYGFYKKRKKRKAHDREVITNYMGELIQYDSSHHRWSLPQPVINGTLLPLLMITAALCCMPSCLEKRPLGPIYKPWRL